MSSKAIVSATVCLFVYIRSQLITTSPPSGMIFYVDSFFDSARSKVDGNKLSY
jgi:hypothetical protein